MRLLQIERLELVKFRAEKIPPYVIASHRWCEDSEVTFQDVQNRCNTNKDGYKKIEAFAEYVRKHIPSIEWLWIDTCCIDKTNAVELSEAINLMFKWYRNAEVCLAYLVDVEAVEERARFEQSEWFRRGWMLQELLAPRTVIFITKDWEVIGNKGASRHQYSGTAVGPGLEKEVEAITGIPEQALHDYNTTSSVSVYEKLKWMEIRSTTCPEDTSYALFGICGVTPGANYGEGCDGARQRLLAAVGYQDDLAAKHAEQFRKIVDWLSPPDPWVNHQSARHRHEPRTGSWLLESDGFRAWLTGSARHLWLSGKAGCGKTILCSTAVEHVKSHCECVANDGYAVFYFSFSDERKRRQEDLVLSLVAQLGWKNPGLALLRQEYEKPNRKVPGLDDLERIVLSCVESYDKFFLLLDAIDESPEDNDIRQDMLTWLTKLAQKAPNLKFLATSRELPSIRTSMAMLGAASMPIAAQAVDKDIQQYVTTGLLLDPRLSRLEKKAKTLIEETISAKAGGMFRWAYCQLQELKKLKVTRPSIITKALSTLPTNLDETYERMLLSIDKDIREDALKLLRWLAYAKAPPSLSELVDATVIDLTGDGSVDLEDRPGLDDTLEILSGLVMAEGAESDYNDDQHKPGDAISTLLKSKDDQQTGKHTRIRLAHFSVKEYLESERILDGGAKEFHLNSGQEHRILTQNCLVYLSYYTRCRDRQWIEQEFTTFPLLKYAAESWFYHAGLQQGGDVTREIRFLCDTHALHTWLAIYQPKQPLKFLTQSPENQAGGLYYASYLGLHVVVSGLLATGVGVNAQGGHHSNALQAASVGGYEKVVQMLIDAGADVNAQGGHFSNALQAASVKGYEKAVQMLIDAGADVNAHGGLYSNALQAASFKGHEKVMRMLIDAGADINAQGGLYSNALQAASVRGYEKVVQMLIDTGADVNAQGGHFSNALQAALVRGYEKVVRMLIDAGADVNAQGGEFGNALQAASIKGYEKVVRMLVDAGADVNAQGGLYSNALQAASWGGHEKVVQVLVDAGAH